MLSLWLATGSINKEECICNSNLLVKYNSTAGRLKPCKIKVEDDVDAKSATLERKDIQSTKSLLGLQLTHALDHTSGQALYALHQGDVSS